MPFSHSQFQAQFYIHPENLVGTFVGSIKLNIPIRNWLRKETRKKKYNKIANGFIASLRASRKFNVIHILDKCTLGALK